jgi:tetratricopeptide (TPR) repeat protein
VQSILISVLQPAMRNCRLRQALGVACFLAAFVFSSSGASTAQQTSKATLETGEPMFAVVTAMNFCGYDQDLDASSPMRRQVREEVAAAARASKPAADAGRDLCSFYSDHRQATQAGDLAQYVSLAINLQGPPFTTITPEADLPPDASYVLGFVPLLQRFYDAAGLHAIWLKHRPEYNALIEAAHDPVANLLMATDVYLKMPIGGYAGRSFTLALEPMAAPGQVNSRNYGENYYMEFAPYLASTPVSGSGSVLTASQLPLKQIRHTYLHFILDPLAAKHGTSLLRLNPLMYELQSAPMDAAFKRDTALMANECLIRAIEARLMPGKTPEDQSAQRREIERAVSEGFVLTRYFFEQLIAFEKTPESLRDAYPDFLRNIDVGGERKRARSIVFAKQAEPELVRSPSDKTSIDEAERSLESGDIDRARQLAQQELDRKQGDPGRALFVLAKAAAQSKDMAGAQDYFLRALNATKDPRVAGWSHIYLGRIYDLQARREAAIAQYRAVLNADAPPAMRAAAERGLRQAYEPPTAGKSSDAVTQPATGRDSGETQPASGTKAQE